MVDFIMVKCWSFLQFDKSLNFLLLNDRSPNEFHRVHYFSYDFCYGLTKKNYLWGFLSESYKVDGLTMTIDSRA